VSIGLESIYRSAAVLLLGIGGCAAVCTTASATPGPVPASVPGRDLVRAHCSGCHVEHDGGFERISALRKTPEGWLMTLARMRQVHGLVLDDGVRDSIVRYLADTQGLAPAESAAGRFALERRPNAQDLDLGPEIGVMCGRCHSLARVSLQRRDEDEWRKLAHTHLGQWPSLEYQASGRDRPWWQIASGPLPAKLAALYPYSSAAWSEWKARPPLDLSGNWVVVGHVPGGNDFYGTARIERAHGGDRTGDGDRADAGDYRAQYRLADVTGVEFNGDSTAIVYTGYEWRGSAQVGDRSLREVYAVSEDGSRITGRWFDADHAEDGGEWTAVRDMGPAQILAVLPRSLRAGAATRVILVGSGFDTVSRAPLSFGNGAAAADVQRGPSSIRVLVKVAADAAPGERPVSVGGLSAKLAVYSVIDRIDVTPGYGIARIGGGRVPPVTAQFEALAWTRLPGGEWLNLGPVPAEWSSIPYDAEAKRTEDDKFAGHFDRRGRYLPNSAGPNPAREYSGDNVGNLTAVARVEDGKRTVEGRGHLIVTVQRWITPPIY
jgi:quinohemoprotein amine dehydrogenase